MFRKLCLVAAACALAFGLVACDPQPSGPTSDGDDWVLVFDDEFDGTALNANNWTPAWFTVTDGYSRGVNGSHTNCYDTRNVDLYGGLLVLSSHPNSDPDCKMRVGSGEGTAPVAGAIVVTDNKFQYATGVIEARVWFDGWTDDACGTGDDRVPNWPAAPWTTGDPTWPDHGEIDVWETGSNGIPRWNIHSNTSPGGDDDPTSGTATCGQGWHTVTMQRTATRCDFWVDGVSKGGSTDCARFAGDTHFIVLENAFDVDSRLTEVGNVVLVDYVRAWQHA